MRYRYLDDFRRGISVFAIFSYGIAVLDTPQCSLFIITQEFKPLMPAQTPANVVPPDLLVSLEEVSSDLHKLSTHKPWDQMEYRTNCYSNLHPN